MNKVALAVSAVAALLALGGAVAAQAVPPAEDSPFGDRGGWGGAGRLSPADRAAFLDARVAALRAGLKLTADQEKLWPPVEEAIRGLARQRREAWQARRERFAAMRDEVSLDVPAQLRFEADRQSAAAAALGRLADASGPLYATLDDGQKRRMAMLIQVMRAGRGPR